MTDDTSNDAALAGADDILSRKEQKTSLYASRVRVYPKAVNGRYRAIKWGGLIALLAIYYITPWLRWDRGEGVPDQAILIDLAGRRAYFFFIEIWAQEVYYLTGILILSALGLFLATSLFGRIWCGYACPQTVWTDLFMWVERLIEGDRNQRMRLDKAPMSTNKLARRAAKHGTWLLIALFTGGAWIMYFQDAPTLVAEFFTGQSGTATYFFVGLFTMTTYLLAGWAREQVCTYMCPWPRIQAALLDEDSLVVTYRDWRGEPRGAHKKNQTWEGRGDCVDCKQCVAVCPMGIDIRDGIQLECIGCALCIDACNGIMDKVGRPRGLIAFDTESNMQALTKEAAALAGGGPLPMDKAPPMQKPRIVRPRTIAYVASMLLVAIIMTVALSTRSSEAVTVLHERNPLFITLSDGSIRNGYQIKLLNMSHDDRVLMLSVEGLEDPTFRIVGIDDAATAPVALPAAADDVTTYQVYIAVPPDTLGDDTVDVTFVVEDPDGGEVVRTTDVFHGP